jgi:hypothetical protein
VADLTAAQGWAALDWLVRTCVPAWLDAAGLGDWAATLRGLAPLTDMDAVRAAAEPLRQAQLPAYRVSGVTVWPEVDSHSRPFGALSANLAASAIVGRDHRHPDSGTVGAVANYAWMVASYAAHAVPDDRCKAVAEMLAGTLPAGVEG